MILKDGFEILSLARDRFALTVHIEELARSVFNVSEVQFIFIDGGKAVCYNVAEVK